MHTAAAKCRVLAVCAVTGRPRGTVATEPVGPLVRRRRERRCRPQPDVALAAHLSTGVFPGRDAGRDRPRAFLPAGTAVAELLRAMSPRTGTLSAQGG
ncbi:hypothetical protein ACWDBD_08670 [Streptomyces sp. NPDC001118]